MANQEAFVQAMQAGYDIKTGSISLGVAMLDGTPVSGTFIKAPLSTLNRHGLVAGATGTGKTKTLQKLAESLSLNGVPVLIMDIKGDVSGISQPGTPNPKIDERQQKIGMAWSAKQFPVEFLTLSGDKGVQLRATVSEFGPVLFSKILELNDTQESVVALIFKYCDDNKLPLLDLKDFKKTLQFLTNEGKAEITQSYGAISPASTSAIMRKVIELEQQGAEQFFGETSFDVEDLCRTDSNGYGYISVLRLADLQSKPKLFSTFMLCLMAEIYEKFPEEGDIEKPKLIFIIDEAHLIFDEASKALLDQIETIIKLIRSKGVGIYFCTQNPVDIPASILSQLGLKIQHALRAFTANDRKAIKLAAQNYPESEFYAVEDMLTQLGTGEAFISVLNEKGIPTPLAHTMLGAPESRMDTITDGELLDNVNKSAIKSKYNTIVDRDSAYEMLTKKIEGAAQASAAAKDDKQSAKRQKDDPSLLEEISKNPLAKQIGREVTRELTRGLLGILGIKRR
jgi:DNA helicase HerA-like ATPase